MGMSALGWARAGFDLEIAVDLNSKAVRAMNRQAILPPVGVASGVGVVPLPEGLDLISGGPVCKAFSPGATLFGTKGQDDPRNTFPLFMEEVRLYRPRYVLIENTFGTPPCRPAPGTPRRVRSLDALEDSGPGSDRERISSAGGRMVRAVRDVVEER